MPGRGQMSRMLDTRVKVADEVWLVTALLHRENPGQEDFAIDEIVQRAVKERIMGDLRPGVYVHVVQHCVANRPANPGRYRMLFQTRAGRRRLFRRSDPYHATRANSKMVPNQEDLPPNYGDLLHWYMDWSAASAASRIDADPLLALSGLGRDLWADEDPDEYVRRLREGWE